MRAATLEDKPGRRYAVQVDALLAPVRTSLRGQIIEPGCK
jgi:hypothetical protein